MVLVVQLSPLFLWVLWGLPLLVVQLLHHYQHHLDDLLLHSFLEDPEKEDKKCQEYYGSAATVLVLTEIEPLEKTDAEFWLPVKLIMQPFCILSDSPLLR